MCGICGITWNDQNLIRSMGQVIKHRGPEQEGFYIDDSISICCERLKILDLSENAKQPLHNEDSSIWVVLNGEIYNFRELANELEFIDKNSNLETVSICDVRFKKDGSMIDNRDNNSLILILDSIQDPRNLGACLRSANAAGVDCVVINKDGSAPINALVHKTSAGALNQLKIFSVTNLSRTIKALKEHNIWVVGLDGATDQSIYQIDLTTPTAIIMGAEGSGLRSLTKKSCDQLAMIPMQGNVESLNVSVATGIALFEASRQRHL